MFAAWALHERAQRDAAVLAEREACAVEIAGAPEDGEYIRRSNGAATIRARGAK